MSLVVTDAVVLHAFDYLESSRVLRLATREHGVQSVLAKGARRSQKRFGGAVDLFAEGQAQYYAKAGRDLHTLASMDITRAKRSTSSDSAAPAANRSRSAASPKRARVMSIDASVCRSRPAFA